MVLLDTASLILNLLKQTIILIGQRLFFIKPWGEIKGFAVSSNIYRFTMMVWQYKLASLKILCIYIVKIV